MLSVHRKVREHVELTQFTHWMASHHSSKENKSPSSMGCNGSCEASAERAPGCHFKFYSWTSTKKKPKPRDTIELVRQNNELRIAIFCRVYVARTTATVWGEVGHIESDNVANDFEEKMVTLRGRSLNTTWVVLFIPSVSMGSGRGISVALFTLMRNAGDRKSVV